MMVYWPGYITQDSNWLGNQYGWFNSYEVARLAFMSEARIEPLTHEQPGIMKIKFFSASVSSRTAAHNSNRYKSHDRLIPLVERRPPGFDYSPVRLAA